MYATRRLYPIGLLLSILVAGCVADGGRGSSGFDITENVIISQVLETQECLSNHGLTVCPADRRTDETPTATATAATPTAAISPTATPTVEPTPQVDTGLADGDSIACTRDAVGAPCHLAFRFAVFGFPSDAAFYVAARLRTPDSEWVLAVQPTLDTTVQPPQLIAPVALPLPAAADDPHVQFAVLIFLTPPASVPDSFAVLAESGTDFAFVTSELALEAITTDPPPTSTQTPTAVEDDTPSPTPSGPTPTATETPLRPGPEITYFGVARADSKSVAPSGFDAQSRPIYVRPFGYALSLIVEGRPGASGSPLGRNGYDPGGALPDLQLIVSRPLGDASTVVCDRVPPMLGGVPATSPFEFSAAPTVIDAINDLGCRADDGQGNPIARGANAACTLDNDGEYSFVDDASTAQFCLPIAVPWGFRAGDTLVAARLRDLAGNLGPQREIVIRNATSAGLTPTPGPTLPSTGTPRPTLTSPPSATGTTSHTPVTHSPTPTSTPRPDLAPEITHLGVARADDRPLSPMGVDSENRPIYLRQLGQGMTLLVEARPGAQPLGHRAYNPDGQPDLEVIVSRPLGDGSTLVCDELPPQIGGVPATDPLLFSDDAAVIAAINDLGCRVDDGAGEAVGRPVPSQACTTAEGTTFGFGFVNRDSKLQYCLPIAFAWAFAEGDTIVAARVRDIEGRPSAAREIVIRVGEQ